jgi:hypothetical protein
MIRSISGYPGDSEKTARMSNLTQVQNYVQYAEAANRNDKNAQDLVRWVKEKTATHEKFHALGHRMQKALSGTFDMDCPFCDRKHTFAYEFSSPIELNPPIHVIEAFQRYGFGDNNETNSRLATVGLRNGFEDWQKFKEYIEALAQEFSTINKVIDELVKTIDAQNLKPLTREGASFIESIRQSLIELKEPFQKQTREKLTGLLNEITAG